MSPISFTQSLKINLRLLREVSWRFIIPLFVVIFAVDYFFEIDVFNLPRLNEEGFIAVLVIMVWCFFRPIFNRSLKKQYKNFQLNFIENQPDLKFYVINCLVNGLFWVIPYVIVNYFIFDRSYSRAVLSSVELEKMSLLQLEEQYIHVKNLFFADLFIFLIGFIMSIFILQWQLNKNSEMFQIKNF